MAYDLHVVRTKNWLDAGNAPITKEDVDLLMRADRELTWSTTDYVEMKDKSGTVTRYYAILWGGHPCFYWYRDQITCAGPDDAQQRKLIQIARALNAYAIGDDGERYEVRKSFFGGQKIVILQADA